MKTCLNHLDLVERYASATSITTNKELIADWDNHKIYMKDSAGAVVEISGSGSSGEETNIINYTIL